MITFENVAKVYEDGFKALDNVNFSVEQGELFVLIGPSGCGKTTTMKMINRLVEPSGGRILVDGKDIMQQDPIKLRREIGYVIQHIGLLPNMTIADNVALVPRLKQQKPETYRQKVDDLLNLVGLEPDVYRDRYPAELSGGQQQRVGVIRALAAEPPIILMDEPFSALDPISREQLQDELVRLNQELKKTIVFVTHDMDEALKIADRICIMEGGKVVQLDTPERILRHPANDFVRSFIGENRLNGVETLPSIQEVMQKPITATPARGLAAAIKVMQKQKVDSLLITAPNGELLGAVRAWDIQQRFQEEDLTLGDIMITELPTVKQEQPLAEAIEAISQHRVAYLPVVATNNKLLGVITRASLVDVMASKFGNSAEL